MAGAVIFDCMCLVSLVSQGCRKTQNRLEMVVGPWCQIDQWQHPAMRHGAGLWKIGPSPDHLTKKTAKYGPQHLVNVSKVC